MVEVRITVDHAGHRKGSVVRMETGDAITACMRGWAEPVETKETAVAAVRETR